MSRLDIAGEARRTIDVIKKGGIAIVPNDTGYACCGSSMDPLKKIYDTKRRGSHKRNAMAADLETQRELHTLRPARSRWWRRSCRSRPAPGVVGTFRHGPPVDPQAGRRRMKASTAVGTISMLLNAGVSTRSCAA